MDELDLSIVVPCFNEGHRLGPTLDTIVSWLEGSGTSHEVVIVDDGSTDNTADLAREKLAAVPHRVLKHAKNSGKGAALRTGMTDARGRIVLFTDADLSTPIDEAAGFLREHESGVPIVIGSRKTEGANVTRHQSWIRENMGKVYTWLSNVAICPGVTDFTCGFKSFEREAAHKIFGAMREDGWAYDTEVLYLARRFGYDVREVPVPWANDPSTRVNLFRDTIGSALGLVRIRMRGLGSAYRE